MVPFRFLSFKVTRLPVHPSMLATAFCYLLNIEEDAPNSETQLFAKLFISLCFFEHNDSWKDVLRGPWHDSGRHILQAIPGFFVGVSRYVL